MSRGYTDARLFVSCVIVAPKAYLSYQALARMIVLAIAGCRWRFRESSQPALVDREASPQSSGGQAPSPVVTTMGTGEVPVLRWKMRSSGDVAAVVTSAIRTM